MTNHNDMEIFDALANHPHPWCQRQQLAEVMAGQGVQEIHRWLNASDSPPRRANP